MARPGFDCAVKTAAIYRDLHDKVKGDLGVGAGCQTQCTECAHICYMNDYIRGQAHCPPHYPVPAIRGWNECTATKDGGGVYGDWSYVSAKAAYVDWSRGTIEVY
jgi:hypothetical protein